MRGVRGVLGGLDICDGEFEYCTIRRPPLPPATPSKHTLLLPPSSSCSTATPLFPCMILYTLDPSAPVTSEGAWLLAPGGGGVRVNLEAVTMFMGVACDRISLVVAPVEVGVALDRINRAAPPAVGVACDKVNLVATAMLVGGA